MDIAPRIFKGEYRTFVLRFEILFKMEDLLKVKHINRILLDNISRYLTLSEENGVSNTTISKSNIITNGVAIQPVNGHVYKPSFKTQIPNGLAASSVIDIFELLTTYSARPITRETFKFCRNGEPAVRVASWNLHEFSLEKASNLGVKEVICRTVLENGVSLVAVQDVKDPTALKIICDELNKPTLRRVEEWKDNSQNWNFCMLDTHNTQLGFLYDSGGVADIELISLMESPEDTKSSCEALIAHFLIGDLNLQIVNITLKKDIDLPLLNQKLIDLTNEEEQVMLCMDFSDCLSVNDNFLTLGGLRPVFPLSTNTHFPNLKPDGNTHITNILVNPSLNHSTTGYKNVINKVFCDVILNV
ncbi:hypothetical protein GWI33_011777 [Rhynchophorus ferrugineus]|uniref:Endonuclease/exonuclease/phosphatase domain-containing protein n=1 Tax=Rhynchophorus ferrugineus TaxID=354439 RepID=A0A834IJU0_RHYFE|nr:hypothetical protein GWI33_011777 [Rhynchophorus ferrugineus]